MLYNNNGQSCHFRTVGLANVSEENKSMLKKNLMFTTMDGVNIGSICKVAILFSNIAHDLLPGQIQVRISD